MIKLIESDDDINNEIIENLKLLIIQEREFIPYLLRLTSRLPHLIFFNPSIYGKWRSMINLFDDKNQKLLLWLVFLGMPIHLSSPFAILNTVYRSAAAEKTRKSHALVDLDHWFEFGSLNHLRQNLRHTSLSSIGLQILYNKLIGFIVM